eukprot:gene5401-6077_t
MANRRRGNEKFVLPYEVLSYKLPKIIHSEEKLYRKNVGEDVKLRCRATGAHHDTNNRTLFFWKNQFGLIRQDRSTWPRFEIRQNKFLKIRNVQPGDAGVYICTATNEYGHTNARRVLKVYQNGKEVTPMKPDKSKRPVRKQPPPHAVKFMNGYQQKPKIIIEGKQRKERTLLVGESTKLKCIVNAVDPPPVITWTKDGKSLQSHPSIGVSTNHQVVHFKNLTLQDSGNYTCIVANLLGSVNYTFRITVKRHMKTSHPSFVSFEKVTAVVGGNVTLNCVTKAKRKGGVPRFRWIKYFPESTKIGVFKAPVQSKKSHAPQRRIHWEFFYHKNGTVVGSLTFKNVSQSDRGWYMCKTGGSQSAKVFKGIKIIVNKKVTKKVNTIEKTSEPIGKPDGQSIETKEGIPLFLLITVPAVAGIVCITVVLVCWRRHKKKENMAKRSRPDSAKQHSDQDGALTNGHLSSTKCSSHNGGSLPSLRNGLHRAPNGAAITVVHHDPVTGTRLQYISQGESVKEAGALEEPDFFVEFCQSPDCLSCCEQRVYLSAEWPSMFITSTTEINAEDSVRRHSPFHDAMIYRDDLMDLSSKMQTF